MVNINKIISEEIDRFINEDVFAEKKKHAGRMDKDISDILTHKKELHNGKAKKKTLKKKKHEKDVYKNGKKLKKGLRTDYNAKLDRETNPNLNNQDAEDINAVLDSGVINVANVAQKVYPDHTPEGAQSQLRKKIKGLENDNGSRYKLKKKEAYKIRRILSKELH